MTYVGGLARALKSHIIVGAANRHNRQVDIFSKGIIPGNVDHVDDHGLDSIPFPLDLCLKPWHLVPVEGILQRLRYRSVYQDKLGYRIILTIYLDIELLPRYIKI